MAHANKQIGKSSLDARAQQILSKSQGMATGSLQPQEIAQPTETVSTVLPRVYQKAIMVREYIAKHHASMAGDPFKGIESNPQRSGLVGTLQDVDDILGGALQWLDEISNILN